MCPKRNLRVCPPTLPPRWTTTSMVCRNALHERDCSGDSEIAIDRAGDGVYSTGPHFFSQGSTPCLDRVKTCQTRRRASSTSRTSQCLNEWRIAVTTTTPPAHDVAILPLAPHPGSAPYTTWAIYPPDVRLTFW